MHELGIVFHIIRSVEGVAEQSGLQSVSSVTLELGEVSGIIPSYLTDCWNWACSKNDLMRGAELVIEEIPALTFCEACGGTYGTVEHGRTCPHCGSERTYLLQGNETTIKEIATSEEVPDGDGGADDVRARTRARARANRAPSPSEGADAAPVC